MSAIFGLHRADDIVIWQFAIQNDYVIVSKDGDFHQLTLVKGPPPKVVWVQRGNCATQEIRDLLKASFPEIESFLRNDAAAFLVIL
jgi:predicted nuclease of predicted toxin-antitoxin system